MNLVEAVDGQIRTKKKKEATEVIEDTNVDETHQTTNNEYPGMQFEATMVGDDAQAAGAKKKKKKKKKAAVRADDYGNEEGDPVTTTTTADHKAGTVDYEVI